MSSRISTPAVFLGLCLLGFIAVGFSVAMPVASLLSGHGPWAPIEACCGGAVAKFSLGWTLLALLGLISSIALIRMVIGLWQLIQVARGIKGLRCLARQENISGEVCLVLEEDRPLAFCAGLIHPQVFLSRVTVDSLSAAELAAVVAHEAHHRKRFDPLRGAAMQVMVNGLFFLPILEELRQKCLESAEIDADEAATRAGAGPQVLAGAMISLHRQEGDVEPIGISPERINGLLGKESFWIPRRAASLKTLASLGLLLIGSAVAIELVMSIPVGIEALGLHFCLAALIATMLIGTAGFAWSRPKVRI